MTLTQFLTDTFTYPEAVELKDNGEPIFLKTVHKEVVTARPFALNSLRQPKPLVMKDTDIVLLSNNQYHVKFWQKELHTRFNKEVKAFIEDNCWNVELPITKSNANGYYVLTNYDTSGRISIKHMICSVVDDFRPFVKELTVLVPVMGEGLLKECNNFLNENGYSDVKVLDPFEEWPRLEPKNKEREWAY